MYLTKMEKTQRGSWGKTCMGIFISGESGGGVICMAYFIERSAFFGENFFVTGGHDPVTHGLVIY